MLTSFSRRVAVGTVAAGLVVAAVTLGSVPAGAAPHHVAASAKSKILTASLQHVSVVPGSSTAWALGVHGSTTTTTPYAERRTGTHWSAVTVKEPTNGALRSIAAGSAKSIWAVGFYSNGKSLETPLIEHSTGGTFKQMKVKLGLGTLTAVAASSESNAWVVGTSATGEGLVLHWNGKKWTKVKVGGAKDLLIFSALSVSSPSNAWMLGQQGSLATPVTAHWNGHSFKIRTLKISDLSKPAAIAGPSAKNAWVTGTKSVTVGSGSRNEVFADHWNGTAWKLVKTPQPFYESTPASVAAFGSDVYIAGQGTPKTFPHGVFNTSFMLQLVDGHWKDAHIATPGKVSEFDDVSVSSKAAVTVGSWSPTTLTVPKPAPPRPLVESLSGTVWKQQSAPK